MKRPTQDLRLERSTPFQLTLPNDWNIPVRVFANEQIDLQPRAVDELRQVLEIQETVQRVARYDQAFFEAKDPRLREVVLTPDFHKGAGIPIGTVLASEGFALPQAIGNDVNCGMRLMGTSLTREDVSANADRLERALRYIFFEGGRSIPMTPAQREALVRHGLPGLLNNEVATMDKGLWRGIDLAEETQNLRRIHGGGGYDTDSVFGLRDYIQGSGQIGHDGIIGNVGGGNHFAEIQYVRKILNGAAANAWGIKRNQIVVMIHSGSLDLGHVTGRHAMDVMRRIYPSGIAHPANKIYPLPVGERFAREYHEFETSMRNAANFAFGNRFFLSRAVGQALEKAVQPTQMKLIYDAPHNLMWEEELDGSPVCLHRKGATPAGGWEQSVDSHYAHWGEPVIVPGSMGASSFLLLGKGMRNSMCSACHGAGRQIARGAAMRMPDEELDEFLRDFRVVTPLDPKRHDVALRPEIVKKWRQQLKQEAPSTYKPITPVIETLESAGIAAPVAELFPLMTVKS